MMVIGGGCRWWSLVVGGQCWRLAVVFADCGCYGRPLVESGGGHWWRNQFVYENTNDIESLCHTVSLCRENK